METKLGVSLPANFVDICMYSIELPYKSLIGWWQGLKESQVADSLLERLLAAGKMEYPAVCAILGGILGQVPLSILTYLLILLSHLNSSLLKLLVLRNKTGSDKGNIRERGPD